MEEKKLPRGIRNNNPLNIRKGNTWKGEKTVQTDKSFEQFISMQYGIRAGFKLIRNYLTGFNGKTAKFNTIEKLIMRWAPPTENATVKYIDAVESRSAVNRRTILDFRDKKTMVNIVDAMIWVENGMAVDRQIIESAYDML